MMGRKSLPSSALSASKMAVVPDSSSTSRTKLNHSTENNLIKDDLNLDIQCRACVKGTFPPLFVSDFETNSKTQCDARQRCAIELCRKLQDDSVPISIRHQLAKNIFKSTEIFMCMKEELALSWLLEELNHCSKSTATWQALLDILSSNRLQSLPSGEINTLVRTNLIETLVCSLHKTEPDSEIYLLILQCVFHLLDKTSFQYYFQDHLKAYFNLFKVLFEGASGLGKSELLVKSLKNLLLFYYLVSQKEEFTKNVFLDLLPFLVTKYPEDASQSEEYRELVFCVREILFPQAKHSEIKECINGLFEFPVCSSSNLFNNLLSLLCCFGSHPESVCSNVYRVIFEAFISSFKTDNGLIFSFFVILCSLVGFQPKLKSKKPLLSLENYKNVKDFVPVCTIGDSTSHLVLKNLFEVLVKTDIHLKLEIHDVAVPDWLQSLVNYLLKIGIKRNTFDILKCIMQLHPHSIESKLDEILELSLTVEENFHELKSSYLKFIRCVLGTFVKLHRLQKFVSKILTWMLHCIPREHSNITSSDILPGEILEEFSRSLASFPGSLNIEMMKTLTYHVNQASVKFMQNGSIENGFLLYVEVMANVVCQFLEGVRIAEHSFPARILKGFIGSMADLRESFGCLGTAILHREHCHRLIHAYLRCCFSFGELQILLLYYIPKSEYIPRFEQMNVTTDYWITHVEDVHSYLTNEQWDMVSQRITNFGDEACERMLNKLTIQSLRAATIRVSDYSIPIPEVIDSKVKRVLDHMNEMWPFLLTIEGSILFPLLSAEQLQEVACHVVKKLVSEEFPVEISYNADLQENRLLVVTLTWEILRQIGKLFTKRKRKMRESEESPAWSLHLSRNVLPCLKPNAFADQSDETLNQIIHNLASSINRACELYSTHSVLKNNFSVNLVLIEKHLKLLQNLPVIFVPEELKLVLVFSILIVAMSVNAMHPDEMEKRSTIINMCGELLQVLLNGQKPPHLAAHIHVGQLMLCLPHLGLDRSLFLKPLVNICLHQEGALAQLEVCLPLLSSDTSRPVPSKAEMETGALVLQILSKVKISSLAQDDRGRCRKFKRRLARGILSFIKHSNVISTPELVPQMLESYDLALRNYLLQSDAVLKKITCYLDVFFEAAISSLSDPSSRQCLAAISLLGTIVQHKQKLQEFLPPDWIRQTWDVLSTGQHTCNASIQLTRLLEVASKKDFRKILKNLLDKTRTSTRCELDHIFGLWKCVASTSVNKMKIDVRDSALFEFCEHFSLWLLQGEVTTSIQVPLLEFELELAKKRLGSGSSELLDLFLETLTHFQLEETPGFVAAFTLSLELLTTLLHHWSVLVKAKIPLYLKGYRHLVMSLSKESNMSETLPQSKISKLADCSYGIERLTNALVKLKKHIAPVSGFIIADIIHEFETWSIQPSVKNHLVNCVFSLLQLCNEHDLAHLSRALTPGSRVIFSNIYRDYMKYHRFTGKV